MDERHPILIIDDMVTQQHHIIVLDDKKTPQLERPPPALTTSAIDQQTPIIIRDDVDTPQFEQPPPEKRKRGHPRKHSLPSPPPSNTVRGGGNTHSSTVPPSGEKLRPKRPRGRPRKDGTAPIARATQNPRVVSNRTLRPRAASPQVVHIERDVTKVPVNYKGTFGELREVDRILYDVSLSKRLKYEIDFEVEYVFKGPSPLVDYDDQGYEASDESLDDDSDASDDETEIEEGGFEGARLRRAEPPWERTATPRERTVPPRMSRDELFAYSKRLFAESDALSNSFREMLARHAATLFARPRFLCGPWEGGGHQEVSSQVQERVEPAASAVT